MESYELEPGKILTWATDYSSFAELEQTAKSLYSIYVSRRKKEHPESHRKAKEYKRKYNSRRLSK